MPYLGRVLKRDSHGCSAQIMNNLITPADLLPIISKFKLLHSAHVVVRI